jgi:hypothetical protein
MARQVFNKEEVKIIKKYGGLTDDICGTVYRSKYGHLYKLNGNYYIVTNAIGLSLEEDFDEYHHYVNTIIKMRKDLNSVR